MEKKYMDKIDEEIERIVRRFGGEEKDRNALDFALHSLSIMVIREYSKAINCEEKVYELHERIEK